MLSSVKTLLYRLSVVLCSSQKDSYSINQQWEMKRVNELKLSYQAVITSTKSPKIMKMMMDGIVAELKMIEQNQPTINMQNQKSNKGKLELTDTNQTGFSHLSMCSCESDAANRMMPHTLIESSGEQLESKIIQKQRIKHILNEQIESNEEQYLYLQESLVAKRQRNEQLDKMTAKITHEINKRSNQTSNMTSAEDGQHPSISARIFKFFSL